MEVITVVKKFKYLWDNFSYEINTDLGDLHEAAVLKLDCSKAQNLLKWRPVWNLDKALEITARWYKEYYENGLILTANDLEEYIDFAKKKTLIWAV